MPTIFNTPGTSTSVSGTTSAPDETTEVVEIDLDQEIEAAHPDADPNSIIPQPPAGQYVLKTTLLDRGEIDNPKASATKDKKGFVSAGFEMRIVDESSPFHDFKFEHYCTSLVQKNRQTSDLHWLMHCVGATLPQTIKLRDLMQLVTETFGDGNSALVTAYVDWKGAFKNGPEKYDYADAFTKMTEFPKDNEGDGYLQEATISVKPSGKDNKLTVVKSGTPDSQVVVVRARAYVAKILPQ